MRERLLNLRVGLAGLRRHCHLGFLRCLCSCARLGLRLWLRLELRRLLLRPVLLNTMVREMLGKHLRADTSSIHIRLAVLANLSHLKRCRKWLLVHLRRARRYHKLPGFLRTQTVYLLALDVLDIAHE